MALESSGCSEPAIGSYRVYIASLSASLMGLVIAFMNESATDAGNPERSGSGKHTDSAVLLP
jgi:hypothetical protein